MNLTSTSDTTKTGALTCSAPYTFWDISSLSTSASTIVLGQGATIHANIDPADVTPTTITWTGAYSGSGQDISITPNTTGTFTYNAQAVTTGTVRSASITVVPPPGPYISSVTFSQTASTPETNGLYACNTSTVIATMSIVPVTGYTINLHKWSGDFPDNNATTTSTILSSPGTKTGTAVISYTWSDGTHPGGHSNYGQITAYNVASIGTNLTIIPKGSADMLTATVTIAPSTVSGVSTQIHWEKSTDGGTTWAGLTTTGLSQSIDSSTAGKYALRAWAGNDTGNKKATGSARNNLLRWPLMHPWEFWWPRAQSQESIPWPGAYFLK